MSHPYVSEDHEGKPWFEWIVAAVVIVATVLAVAGYTKAATACDCGDGHSDWTGQTGIA